MAIEGISDTGFTLVYEPGKDAPPPVVDIVIVHGLQGHPFTTWACPKPQVLTTPASSPSMSKHDKRDSLRAKIRRRIHKPSSERATAAPALGLDAAVPTQFVPEPLIKLAFFWPRDLLPNDCPRSRVLVYGYDSKVTKYLQASTNKNSILSHGKDLLFSLSRARQLDRPLILVAHSLGGIVVKEMLAQSSTATDDTLQNIVDSVSSVIFLGTPHRGSPELAAVGEWARSLAGTLRMETNDAILNALSLKTTDLERAQESFSNIWFKHDFRVKTFQEGLALTGVNLSVLGNKVVPDNSSLIGDARERAETIQANHRDMCRFTSPSDPNYAKVSGELTAVYTSLVSLNEENVHNEGHIRRLTPRLNIQPPQHDTSKGQHPALTSSQASALRQLWYPSMNDRGKNMDRPAEKTCQWLLQNHDYQDWLQNKNQETRAGLLWLKGKPGAGKSTLMNEVSRRAEAEQETSGYRAAHFFFNAKGSELERSPLGLFRSLLHRLLPHHPSHLRRLVDILSAKQDDLQDEQYSPTVEESELRELFVSIVSDGSDMRTLIFIDGLDECNATSIRSQAYFWRDITKSNPKLSVCLSSRHFPSVTVTDCSEIIVDLHNHGDITTFVDQRLGLAIADNRPEKQALRNRMLEKSAGVFLWVTLVIDDILKKWDEGSALSSLLEEVDNIPEELEMLLSSIIKTVKTEDRNMTIRLFEWAILATRPLRLYEWEHVLCFIQDKPPQSLRDWRPSAAEKKRDRGRPGGSTAGHLLEPSIGYTDNSVQTEKQIRTLSKGLIEVQSYKIEDLAIGGSRASSVYPGAGSLEFGHGENRIVQVIHESVREFFLQTGGFTQLDSSGSNCFAAQGHLSIMNTCLDYIMISELDALVHARLGTSKPSSVTKTPSTSSSISKVLLPVNSMPRWDILAIPRSGAGCGSVDSIGSFESAYSARGGSYTYETRPDETEPDITEPADMVPSEIEPGEMVLLRKATEEAWGRDMLFSRRISMYCQMSADKVSITHSAIEQSTGGHTRILEDYPALLSYAVFQMFVHARLAQEAGANPTGIISRLRGTAESKNTLWVRWLALAEHLPLSTGLVFYAANQRLSTWMTILGGCNRAIQSEEAERGSHCMNTVHQCDRCSIIWSAIVESIKRRNPAALRALLRHFPYSTTFRNPEGDFIIHVLARVAYATLMRTFLTQSTKSALDPVLLLRNIDANGQTPLHIAARRLNIDTVAELLKHHANVNTNDSCLKTPLMLACCHKSALDDGAAKANYDIIKRLLEGGASINAMDQKGQTALHCACINIPEVSIVTASRCALETEPSYVVKMVDLLLQHGADTTLTDELGATALHVACRSGEKWRKTCPNALAIINLLIDSGADPAATTLRDETPLHIAAARSSGEVAATLIQHGAPISARDCLGQVPIHHAAWAGNEPVLVELLANDKFEDIDPVDERNSTPLHFACQFYNNMDEKESRERRLRVIRLLLDRGAKVDEPNNWLGLSPIGLAQKRELHNVVTLLMEFFDLKPSLMTRFVRALASFHSTPSNLDSSIQIQAAVPR